jgi:glycopeptide antibiotics resistance protein
MRSFLVDVPLAGIAAVLALVVVAVGSPAVARVMRTSRAVAALLLFGFGLVVAATLTPDAAALAGEASDGNCDLSRIGLAPLNELVRINYTTLNVLLFVPLGVAVGLLPRSRTAALVTLAAISLPFVVEAVQLVVTALGRGCQSAEVVDNLLGLAVGIGVGTLLRPFIERLDRRFR